MTAFLAAFLTAHGLVHLALWLPRPQPAPDRPPPFQPDHSALLDAAMLPEAARRQLSVGLAVGATAAYLLAAVGVVLSASWAAPVAVAAALLGLALKIVFFSPWLTVGILVDAVVLTSALADWPVALP